MRTHTSGVVGAGIVAVLFATAPSHASADWLIAGYVGASHTASTTLRVTPAGGTPFELSGVDFDGQAWRSPIYYGYRVGWLGEDSPIGVEAEFTHAKTIATDTRSTTLTHFEQSHGLNLILGNFTYRSQRLCRGHCVVVGRAGAGVTIPHVEAAYLGASVSSYQFGGPAIQVGIGLERAVHGGLTAIADGRLTHSWVTDDLPGATLSSSFTTWHFTFGAGWRFGL